MNLVLGQSEQVCLWIAQRVPYFTPDPRMAAIGVARDKLIAGVAYHSYQPEVGDIQVTLAADHPSWAQPGVVARLMEFPFVQLECRRASAFVARKNKRSRRWIEGVGFKMEGKVRRGLPDDDLIGYGLLREEAERFLKRLSNGR